ncbi:MAG: hypothetical protein ACLQNE_13105, partial [Thermoguttaceae bacterium]
IDAKKALTPAQLSRLTRSQRRRWLRSPLRRRWLADFPGNLCIADGRRWLRSPLCRRWLRVKRGCAIFSRVRYTDPLIQAHPFSRQCGRSPAPRSIDLQSPPSRRKALCIKRLFFSRSLALPGKLAPVRMSFDFNPWRHSSKPG